MTRPPYPAPVVCADPTLGAQASQALGRVPSAIVAAHLVACPACRVQRTAFRGLDDPDVVALPLDVREALRRTVRDRFPRRA